MAAENIQLGSQAIKTGETISPGGIIIPAGVDRPRNIRETIQGSESTQRSLKYNSQGVNFDDPNNYFFQPKNPEKTSDVKSLAEKQPRRVRRTEDGVMERLVKYSDGTFDWAPVPEKSETVDGIETQGDVYGEVLKEIAASVDKLEHENAWQAKRIDEQDQRIAELEALVGAQGGHSTGEAQPETETSGDSTEEITKDTARRRPTPADMPKRRPTQEAQVGKSLVVAQETAKEDISPSVKEARSDDAKAAVTTFETNYSSVSPTNIPESALPDFGTVQRSEEKESGKKPEAVDYGKAAFAVDSKGEAEIVSLDMKQDQTSLAARERLKDEHFKQMQERDKPGRFERMKRWFHKEKKMLVEYGGAAYWSEKWARVQRGFHDNVLEYRVTDEMDDSAKERQRRRNRVAVIAGASAMAFGAAYLIRNGLDNPLNDSQTLADASEAARKAAGPLHHAAEAGDVVNPSGAHVNPNAWTPDQLAAAEHAEALSNLNDAYTITPGQGGEALFRDLGIDPSKWYANEQRLLDTFPDSFYRMNDGHVGIVQSGTLPIDVQNTIESLR